MINVHVFQEFQDFLAAIKWGGFAISYVRYWSWPALIL